MLSNRKWLQLHFLLFLDVGEVSSNQLLHVLSCKNLQEERVCSSLIFWSLRSADGSQRTSFFS